MAKVFLLGVMEENMKDSIKMIKKKVMGYLHGQTEEFIKEIGKIVNNMDKAFILMWKEKK